MKYFTFTLPTGFFFEGKLYRNAQLRAINGEDELLIKEFFQGMPAVECINLLLARCLMKLGPTNNINPDDVRRLTVGDRDALFMRLRSLTYGDKIQTVLVCPQTDCKEKMDLDLSISDFLIPPVQNAKEIYELTLTVEGVNYLVSFRLPTAGDQEEIAGLGAGDPESASLKLLRLCVLEIMADGQKLNLNDNFPVELMEALSRRMEELDPQAEIMLKMICPACKKEFVAGFDIGDFFLKELIIRTQNVFKEIHLLAMYYHWNERDILNMTRSRRQIYLNMLAETFQPEAS